MMGCFAAFGALAVFAARREAVARREQRYEITYRRSLARVIEQNTGADVQPNVFEVEAE